MNVTEQGAASTRGDVRDRRTDLSPSQKNTLPFQSVNNKDAAILIGKTIFHCPVGRKEQNLGEFVDVLKKSLFLLIFVWMMVRKEFVRCDPLTLTTRRWEQLLKRNGHCILFRPTPRLIPSVAKLSTSSGLRLRTLVVNAPICLPVSGK